MEVINMPNNIITEMSETMTTEEYLRLIKEREQEELDKEFDEELKKIKEKTILEQIKKSQEEYIVTLINKLADIESEINICESILLKTDSSINYSKFDENEIRKQLTTLKRNHTKVQNELNKIIKEEK